MGQAANSGRHASLDDKKERAAGRQQNDPATEAITDRQEAPPVPGAFGREGKANRRGSVAVTGDTSGDAGGGPVSEDIGKNTRPTTRKRKD